MHFEFTLITLYLLILSSTITKKTRNELEYNLNLSPTLLKYHPLTFIENISIQHPTIIYNWLTHVRVRKQSSTVMSYRLLLILLMIGGIETNPGPVKYPCGFCEKPCKSNQKAVACDECNQWFHAKCMGISDESYHQLGNTSTSWFCTNCNSCNHSTTLYDVPLSNNSFSLLSDCSSHSLDNTTSSSIWSPLLTSSPKTSNSRVIPNHQRKGLRTIITNFQSIKNKAAELEVLIETTAPDVIIGTETWTNKDILSSELFPDTYTVYRRDRGTDNYGGILIAVHTSLTSSEIFSSKAVELIAVKIDLPNGKQLIVSSFYRPPGSGESYLDSFKEDITSLKQQHKKAIFHIGGDFNAPDIDWKSHNVLSGNNIYPKYISESIVNTSEELGLEQVITCKTRGDNILDLLFTSHPTLIEKIRSLPPIGKADHDVILCDAAVEPVRSKHQRREIFLWKRANMDAIREEIKNNYKECDNIRDINLIWAKFKGMINDLMRKHIPTKFTRSRPSHPWIDTHLNRLTRRKNRAHQKARRTKNNRDRNRYNKLKTSCQREIRLAREKYLQEVISEDSKRFWSYIKHQKQDSSGVSPLKGPDGLLHSDTVSKAEILNNQFHSVYTKEDLADMPSKGDSPHPSMNNIRIGRSGVCKLLKGLNVHKATGPDTIPARFLQDFAPELTPIMTKLFQLSLDTGKVPDDWREASIVPIFKKGERHLASNYRPVSLTSISCKLLEHIVHSQIMDHYDSNHILADQQHGFRARRSCESQLLITVDEVAKSLAHGEQVDIVLLDFSKAFDKVPHQRLLHKLHFYGIRGNTWNWIKDFLAKRTQQVNLEGQSSTRADVISGVPQGTVMGPLLFLTYINDLPEHTSSDARLFADDCLLYRKINSRADAEQLQKDLKSLEKWEREWQMEFHPQKCTVIHVSRKQRPITNNYLLHGHTLESVSSGKYLGVTINNRLNWTEHINNVRAKSSKTLGFLRRNIQGCRADIKSAAYSTIVRPTLEYAATVWDPYQQAQIQLLEGVQRRAARFVKGNYYVRTPGCVTSMMEDLQWEPLETRRLRSRLIMMYKIRNDLIDIPATSYLTPGDTRTRGSKYRQPPTYKDVYKFSFFPRTIRDWNSLSDDVKEASTIDGFKKQLNNTLAVSYDP